VNEPDPYALLKECKRRKDWWSAREEIERLIAASCGGVDVAHLRQQAALCTYKDPELRRSSALDQAVERLLGDRHVTPEEVDDAETAGLVGAVCKRRWELDGREEHLRDALRWYERGAVLAAHGSPATWDGYQDINAAYVADVLAHVRQDDSSVGLRTRASELRRGVIDRLGPSPDNWWATATLLEARLGLGGMADCAAMLDLVRRFSQADHRGTAEDALAAADGWERESTAVQLARLAAVLSPPVEPSDLAGVIKAVIPEAHDDAVVGFGHRFGVALSGGGFRASLFHLGVLAALAEHDLLRPMEVLSCVSGGSIVGTAYYSAVATLLETKTDVDITRDDLVEATRRCIASVEHTVTTRNLRMEAFLSPVALVRGVRHGRWSRTRRGGMLYERHLYQPLRPDGAFESLSGLKILPKGTQAFRPKVDNWQRAAKVPTLLINATSLGTGRPWRFTASSLGEPVDDGTDTDPIDRLEPIWLDRSGGARSAGRVSVGDAVAASAGVPGLFPPVTLRDLYPDRTVALVDGGVFDNQGISGLLDHDCTEIFVSDASGLMGETRKPKSTLLRVLLRTNAVALNAVRGTTFGGAAATVSGGRVRSAWTIHLLSGLPVHRVHPSDSSTTRGSVPPVDEEQPAVRDQIYRAISELRTDLDRFTAAEAHALMARGYALTQEALAGNVTHWPGSEHPSRGPSWRSRTSSTTQTGRLISCENCALDESSSSSGSREVVDRCGWCDVSARAGRSRVRGGAVSCSVLE
jgi:predicted acylesterase/phospholipase RssA